MRVCLTCEWVVKRVERDFDEYIRHVLWIVIWDIMRLPNDDSKLKKFFWDTLDVPKNCILLDLPWKISFVLHRMDFYPKIDIAELLSAVGLNQFSPFNRLPFHNPVTLIVESLLKVYGSLPNQVIWKYVLVIHLNLKNWCSRELVFKPRFIKTPQNSTYSNLLLKIGRFLS